VREKHLCHEDNTTLLSVQTEPIYLQIMLMSWLMAVRNMIRLLHCTLSVVKSLYRQRFWSWSFLVFPP